MTKYVGLVERVETGYWCGTVAGVPGAITQAAPGHLREIQANFAQALWALTDEPVAEDDITVTVELGPVRAAAEELAHAV